MKGGAEGGGAGGPGGGGGLPLRLIVALALMGLTALVAQVVLTRELLGVFLGNELSIALVLAVWLGAVAAGSAVGARVAPGLGAPVRVLGGSQMVLACLLPVSLLAARSVEVGGATRGQAMGPGAMLLTSLLVLSPVCVVGGFQFVVGVRAAGTARERRQDRAVSVAAAVYALEAAGAAVGGGAFHFYLSQHAGGFAIMAALGLLNVVSGAALVGPRLSLRGARVLAPALLVAVGLAALLAQAEEAELASVRMGSQWSGADILAARPSKYGAVVIAEREGQISVFQSGVLLFTYEDDYANEVTAHLPLLEHPAPRRVMLIGGAAAGVPGEVLKHPVQRLDCVELDPLLVRLARGTSEALRAVGWTGGDPLDDPRVRLHYGDGRLLAREASGSYDVIIVNVPDPTTGAINRFYTKEFLQEARGALAPGGILALSLSGSYHHLSGSVLLAAATTSRTLEAVFGKQLLVPGDRMFFLAAKERGGLSGDWEEAAGRLRERGLETSFVNEAWLEDALLPFRREQMMEAIRGEEEARVNRDLNPVSYYHQTRVWLEQLSPGLARPMRAIAGVRVWWGLGAVALAGAAVLVMRGRRRRLSRAAALVGAGAIGGFGLLVEVLCLLAFQSACGYLYHALGALIAAFMVGLAAGSGVMSRWDGDRRSAARVMAAGLGVAGVVCALLPGLLGAVLPAPGLALGAVGVVLALAGSLVGGLFPAATALYREGGSAAGAGGAVYAADLVGSAGAGLAAGVVGVPVLGAAGASYMGALVLGGALVLALPLLRE